MDYTEAIIDIGKENGGYIVGKNLSQKNIPRVYLARMERQGILNCLTRGIFILSNYPQDEFYTNALRYKKAVFSRHTALYLNNLSNRQIECIEANFPIAYNTEKIQNIKCCRLSRDLYELGKTIVITPLGHKVNSYNIERCLCDLFYYDDFDIEEKSYAVKAVDRTKLNYDRLFDYAAKMKVLPQVKSVFEVL